MIISQVTAIFDGPGGGADCNTVWGDIASDDCTGANNAALPDGYTINHDHAGANPDIIFNYNSSGCNALLSNRPGRILVNTIHGYNLHHWPGVYSITNSHPTLPTYHIKFAYNTVLTDGDTRLWQITKIENV
jgi:hypothetical protein